MQDKKNLSAELIRDGALYKKMRRRITFEEKVVLMSFIGDYARYQKELFALAKKRGVEIPPAD